MILSVGTGGGHNAAGYAIKEELLRRGHRVEMMNPYDLKGGRTSKLIDNTYVKLVQTAPKLFGCVYYIGDAYRHLPWRSPVYFANRKMAALLKEYLDSHHYDIVIMPHLYPAEMMTSMEYNGWDKPLTLFISTDYTCSPFVEETRLDAYVLPAADLSDEFSGYGVPVEKTYALGIPTLSGYRADISPAEAKTALGLDTEKEYVLIMGGSMGSGNIVKICSHVSEWCCERKNCVPIVICGSNQRLYNRIKKKFGESVLAVGYTDKVPLYMKSSIVVMTKPGGLSTTEAASAGVPIVHITPIPGCESKNMRYFGQKGMSIPVSNSKESIKNALNYLEKSENRDKMVVSQREHLNADAALDICDLAERLVLMNESAEKAEEDSDLLCRNAPM